MKNTLIEWWSKIPLAWQEKIISASHTFISVFVSVAIVTLQNGHVEWTWAFWGSIVSVALRMAWKSAWEVIMPPSLGGVKK